MDGIIQSFGSIDIGCNQGNQGNTNPTLTHDVAIIIYCWRQQEMKLCVDDLVIQPGEFKSTSELFQLLCAHVHQGISIIDIMPYIDDYLEYYDMLCRIF